MAGRPHALQDSTRVYRIFWVSTDSQPDPFLAGFREGLRARGYVEGKNLAFELHYAPGNPQALREVVSELRRGNIDLAVSSGPATRAMTAVTDVPVLFALSGDPVELGIVKSLGEPGGNFTGSTFLSLELAGKRVELLKEAVPTVRRLAVFSNSLHPGEQSEWRATREAAKALGIETVYVPFAGKNELDKDWRRRETRARTRCWSSRTSSRWCTEPKLPTSPSRIGCRRCSAGANIATPADF